MKFEAFLSEKMDELYAASKHWYDTLTDNESSSSHVVLALLSLLLFVVIGLTVVVLRKYRKQVQDTIMPDTSQPRFRKRDKVLFYGRRMLRKVKTTIQGRFPQLSTTANPIGFVHRQNARPEASNGGQIRQTVAQA